MDSMFFLLKIDQDYLINNLLHYNEYIEKVLIVLMFRTIRSKLILLSILLLTIPLIILGTFSYQKASTTLDESGSKRLETSVELTLKMIESLNKEVEKGNLSLLEAQEHIKVTILGEAQSDGTRPIDDNIDLGENGYLFILDENGQSLAHPNTEGDNYWEAEDQNGTLFIQETIDIGKAGGGFSNYYWPLPNNDNQIEEKVTYSKIDPHWNWVVSASTYMIDFNKPAQSILHVIYIVVAITITIGTIIVWFYTSRIGTRIQTVTERMNSLADGDLSFEKLTINSSDETGRLANALNQMQENLSKIISNIVQSSRTITNGSEELTQAANEVSEGTEQVAMTMQELASGAESQAYNSNQLLLTMESFVDKIEQSNRTGEQIEESTVNVLNMTEQGEQLMESSTEQMKLIDEIVNEAVERVEGLDIHTQEISEIVSVIQDIAEQTNLLALNAAIEAARAGEHGQGFAVVAAEVRKLAEESASSVGNITEIVQHIQSESSNAAQSLKAGYKEVEHGTDQMTTTGQTFNEISIAVAEMVNNIRLVSDNLSEIVSNSLEMNKSFEEIAAISEQSAAGIEETTATTEEVSAAMEQVASNSNQLVHIAEELNELIVHFKM